MRRPTHTSGPIRYATPHGHMTVSPLNITFPHNRTTLHVALKIYLGNGLKPRKMAARKKMSDSILAQNHLSPGALARVCPRAVC